MDLKQAREVLERIDDGAGLWPDRIELYVAIRAAIAEVDELEAAFDLRWKADMRAIEDWREITGRELTSPDHADLVVWLGMRRNLWLKR